MKYIRTKDGIYKRREDNYIEDNILYQIGYDFGRICLGEVIKEADTIEELCDEFVVIQKDNKPYRPSLIYGVDIKQFYAANKHTNCEVNGAIWTEKGLIYVAKMSDKGELELI